VASGPLALGLVAMGGACSLDWAGRADPGDAGADTALADRASAEASGDAADASAGDASAGDAAPCATLAADVARTKAKARDCTLGQPAQCTTTVQDECDCPVIVRTAGAPLSNDYASAIAALVAACGKPASCTTCAPLGVPASWACLQPATTPRCVP
jgi:hypothetical protein